MSRTAVLRESFKANLSLIRDYASLLSGSAGRLVLSLAYFVCVANGLSISDFGLFATASATGVVLSRLAAFGFVSPLYRVATVKRRLLGTYTLGYLIALALSLPLVAVAGAGFYFAIFDGQMGAAAFTAIVVAEVICWRSMEVVVIVNNGLGRFGRGAILVIAGSALRALAAIGFWFWSDGSLIVWALAYLGANAVAAIGAAATSYPKSRMRFRPSLYLARWRDSVSVAGAEIVFYLQSELDKLLVLSLGGPAVAGLYAIVMRLVDLTAIPVRSFNTMIVQKLMKTPAWLDRWNIRIAIEGAVAIVSIAGLVFLGGFLHFFPTALGGNVADAAPLILLALMVPAFRNLVEYESELLYARGLTTTRVVILAIVGLTKAGLLAAVLHAWSEPGQWVLALNAVFALLWLISAVSTYVALDWRRPSFGGRASGRGRTTSFAT